MDNYSFAQIIHIMLPVYNQILIELKIPSIFIKWYYMDLNVTNIKLNPKPK